MQVFLSTPCALQDGWWHQRAGYNYPLFRLVTHRNEIDGFVKNLKDVVVGMGRDRDLFDKLVCTGSDVGGRRERRG